MFRVTKVPTDALALTNCAVVSRDDFDCKQIKHVRVQTGPDHQFLFSIKNDMSMKRGEIAFALPQRKWAMLSLDEEVLVVPHTFANDQRIGSIVLSAEFNKKTNVTSDPWNVEAMTHNFLIQFSERVFTKDEKFVFRVEESDCNRIQTFVLVVKSIKGIDVSNHEICSEKELHSGVLMADSRVVFDLFVSELPKNVLQMCSIQKEFLAHHVLKNVSTFRDCTVRLLKQNDLENVNQLLRKNGKPSDGETLAYLDSHKDSSCLDLVFEVKNEGIVAFASISHDKNPLSEKRVGYVKQIVMKSDVNHDEFVSHLIQTIIGIGTNMRFDILSVRATNDICDYLDDVGFEEDSAKIMSITLTSGSEGKHDSPFPDATMELARGVHNAIYAIVKSFVDSFDLDTESRQYKSLLDALADVTASTDKVLRIVERHHHPDNN